MTLDASGNLLVGTTSSTLGSLGSIFGGSSGSYESSIAVSASGNVPLRLYNKGSSGTQYFLEFRNSTSAVGSITYNGTTTVLNPTSDVRLKENIVDAGSALDKINAVRIRSFNWKSNNHFTDFGVIAQELNEVAPECVKVGSDEINENGELKDPWGAQPYVLVPAAIKAIQELNALITTLTARITALEGA
jgi:hypothetical protein